MQLSVEGQHPIAQLLKNANKISQEEIFKSSLVSDSFSYPLTNQNNQQHW